MGKKKKKTVLEKNSKSKNLIFGRLRVCYTSNYAVTVEGSVITRKIMLNTSKLKIISETDTRIEKESLRAT